MNNTESAPAQKNHTSKQLIPYQWFWTDVYGQRMGFSDWLKSRPFTLVYLVIAWAIVSALGFASTRNCDETWQLAFACDQAIWMIKMMTEPVSYVLSWFTAPFFHNGLDHILFVTIFGFLLPVQSFEVQHGPKATAIIFFVSYIVVGIFFGSLFNWGIAYWPESEFFQFGFVRNWMGGSVGFYALIGALAYTSQKQWFLLLLVATFEVINLTIIGIDIHISFIHVISLSSGFITCFVLKKRGLVVLGHT
ncbi:MAG: rhomboid family intramembrane serine protease [Reichenbachiella sp.]|uniref:rhomboid family intramembrane serine protease n=1 Tax=Reichenbachiella sp. TaxID=2184521 RepID=UPI0032670D1C